MAAKDRATLQAELDASITSGIVGGILAQTHNDRATDTNDSALNIEEPAEQTVVGPVVFESNVTIPPDTILQDGELVRYDSVSGDLVPTGVIDNETLTDFGDKTLRAGPESIEIGAALSLSERGGFLQLNSDVTDKAFLSIDAEVDETGSKPAINYERAAKDTRVIIQADDSQVMLNVTGYTSAGNVSEDILKQYLNFVNPVTNFRATVTSDVTGEIVKYIPTRTAYEAGTGIDFAAGEQSYDLQTPLAEIQGYPLTIAWVADQQVDVLGDGVTPWRAIDRQLITEKTMVDESMIALESVSTSLISGGEITLVGPTQLTIAAGEGRIVDAAGNVTPVEWDEKNVVIIFPTATIASLFTIDEFSVLDRIDGGITPELIRNQIVLGVLSTIDLNSIDGVFNASAKTNNVYSQMVDILDCMGVTRCSGLLVTANADLTVIKQAGALQALGIGLSNSEVGNNIMSINGQTPALFKRVLNATGTSLLENASTDTFDPTFWDDGSGTKQLIGGAPTQATNIYLFQNPVATGGLTYAYGQTLYPTIDDAILNVSVEQTIIPSEYAAFSNLLMIVSITADALSLQDDTKVYFTRGPKFGIEVSTGAGVSGGGGDTVGAANSTQNEITTFSDTTGKSLSSASDITALNGAIQRVSVGQGVAVENSTFKAGDAIQYPIADGLAGDAVTTDGAGILSLSTDNFEIVTSNTTMDHADKRAYIDSSSNPIDIILGDAPRNGERKLLWVADNTNTITLLSANPSFPISPPINIAEANIQGEWTLQADFLDRFTTNRDLTNVGSGGAFVPVTVNGVSVQAFDFENTAKLEATASDYRGVTGSAISTASYWYGVSIAGIPSSTQYVCSWGSTIIQNGVFYQHELNNGDQQFKVNLRATARKWNYATLDALGVFDGNMHHWAITKSGSGTGTILLYIDGVRIPHDSQDTFPTPNVISEQPFRIGTNVTNNGNFDGILYDFRLFNKALSQEEVVAVRDQNLQGGLVLSSLQENSVVDVTYNGSLWVVADAVPLSILDLGSRVSTLETNEFTGAGSSVVDHLATYSDDTGQAVKDESEIAALAGVLSGASASLDLKSAQSVWTFPAGPSTVTMSATQFEVDLSGVASLDMSPTGSTYSASGAFFEHRIDAQIPTYALRDESQVIKGIFTWGGIGNDVVSVSKAGGAGIEFDDALIRGSFAGNATTYTQEQLKFEMLNPDGVNTAAMHVSGSTSSYNLGDENGVTKGGIAWGGSTVVNLFSLGGSSVNVSPTGTDIPDRLSVGGPNSPFDHTLELAGSTTGVMQFTTLTTAQRNALNVGAGCFNFNPDTLVFEGTTAIDTWVPFSGGGNNTTTVFARCLSSSGYTSSGVEQTIVFAGLADYQINGIDQTKPNLIDNGVPIVTDGMYTAIIKATMLSGSGTEVGKLAVFGSVNDAPYDDDPFDYTPACVTAEEGPIQLSQDIRLAAGDVMKVKYLGDLAGTFGFTDVVFSLKKIGD